jgi:Fe-S cluster assembly iron-binding protein IscA
MALDEPRQKDLTFNDRDIMYAVDKDLYEKIKPIYIDFVESAKGSGFKITSNLTTTNSCDSCGG